MFVGGGWFLVRIPLPSECQTQGGDDHDGSPACVRDMEGLPVDLDLPAVESTT